MSAVFTRPTHALIRRNDDFKKNLRFLFSKFRLAAGNQSGLCRVDDRSECAWILTICSCCALFVFAFTSHLFFHRLMPML